MDLLIVLFLQACGVDFEVKAYVAKSADDPDEKIDKKQVCYGLFCTFNPLLTVLLNFYNFFFSFVSLRDTCRLIIRKIQFAPDNTGSGQKAELCKSFMMSDKPVLLEASLSKEVCNL